MTAKPVSTDHEKLEKRELTDAERSYLSMMYAEHAEQARQHETLRAAVASLLVALIAGLLAFQGANPRWVGLLVCAASVLGLLLNQAHYERNRLHVAVLTGMRKKLEADAKVGEDVSGINKAKRDAYRNCRPWLTRLRLRLLWPLIFVVTFGVGLAMALCWLP